uniref:Uncharacterized protein n=1 Tax=Sphaerodactylus townsendi TaxID=933632 RepID=A0ACB8F1J5_9SAUR
MAQLACAPGRNSFLWVFTLTCRLLETGHWKIRSHPRCKDQKGLVPVALEKEKKEDSGAVLRMTPVAFQPMTQCLLGSQEVAAGSIGPPAADAPVKALCRAGYGVLRGLRQLTVPGHGRVREGPSPLTRRVCPAQNETGALLR